MVLYLEKIPHGNFRSRGHDLCQTFVGVRTLKYFSYFRILTKQNQGNPRNMSKVFVCIFLFTVEFHHMVEKGIKLIEIKETF